MLLFIKKIISFGSYNNWSVHGVRKSLYVDRGSNLILLNEPALEFLMLNQKKSMV